MESKVLLFDFDGTIADTLEAGIRIYNEIARQSNLTQISKENLPTLRNNSAIDNIRYLRVPMTRLPFIARQVRAAMRRDVPNLKAISGIQQPLLALKEKGYLMYVVSSNSKENIHHFLQLNQIDIFDDIYSVPGLFGKDAKIRRLVDSHGWDRSRVVYIGDEVRDMRAAKKAGVMPVAVAWGYNTKEALARELPMLILQDPAELSSL